MASVRPPFCILIFSSRTTYPISTKLGTKHPWMKGIQAFSNEGPGPYPRWDNYELAKMYWQIFPRTSVQISTKLSTKHIGWREFKFIQMKGQANFQGEIITKKRKQFDTGEFQPNLAQRIRRWGWFKFVQMKCQAHFQREIITDKRKYISRTTVPITTKLGTEWDSNFYSNEGPCPFSRGDNNEIVKIHWQILKIFSRTTGPISTKLGTNHPLVKFVQIKDPALIWGETITK